MSHTTQEPQRVDSSRADAEWKADPGLGDIIHGADGAVGGSFFWLLDFIRFITIDRLLQGSEVDRSSKAAPVPEVKGGDGVASGGGSRGTKGWTGDGKGPLDPENWMPKRNVD
jgi:hypothetical protein